MRRRAALAGMSASVALKASAATARNPIAALEARHGGRLAVIAVDTGSGRTLMHRADERCLMCSTFKLLAVAFVLSRVDAGAEHLDRTIRFGAAELSGLDHAAATHAHIATGAMPVGDLCEAALTLSDNKAANLLLTSFGGPPALTHFLRGIGDSITRLDRYEPTLNDPAGDLDTTTPRAMAASARAILLGDVLGGASRERLNGWMIAASTGLHRLRAGVPRSWQVGDKTGTGHTQTNDVAILRPPKRPPLIVAAFYQTSRREGAAREAVLRGVGALVAEMLG